MIVDLPSTTTIAVSKKLVRLRQDVGAMALSRVLTLVVVVDEKHAEEAIEVANDASHQHPCRIIAVVTGNKRGVSRLDAQIRSVAMPAPVRSSCAPLRPLTAHGRSVVIPLLHRTPRGGVVAAGLPAQRVRGPDRGDGATPHHRRRTGKNPRAEMKQRAKTYAPGDSDLAWTRVTLWRGLLAAALDQPPFEPVVSATVTGASDSPRPTCWPPGWPMGCTALWHGPARALAAVSSACGSSAAAGTSTSCAPRATRRRCSSPASPTAPSRFRIAATPSASPTSCAASTPTRCTPRS